MWNAQVTFGNAATPLGSAQTALVNSAALKACDGLDGVVDGVIDNPLTCPFKVASLLCAQNQDPSTCLTQAQVTAFEKVYQGPRNPVTAKLIYPGYSPGTELGWGSNTTGPVPSTAQNFFKFMVYNDPNWNYQTFNFNSDVAFTDAKFAVTLDAVNPDLRAFKRRGGKILQSHLWSSTTHPARRTIEWYDQVVSFMKANDGDTQGDDHKAIPVFLTTEISARCSSSIASSWRRAEAAAKGRVRSIHFRILSVGSSRGFRQARSWHRM